MHPLLLILLLILSASGLRLHGEEPLQVLYNPRPPYMVPTADGEVTGLTADAAAYALRKAGIPFRWVEVPSTRQLFMIRENKSRLAALGWYCNPERDRFARFSSPLYQDRQIGVLARKDNAKVAAQATLDQLLKARDLTLLVKTDYSYGPFLDARIAGLRPRLTSVTVENLSMIQMIHAGRADYMFIAPEEAEASIPEGSMQSATLKCLIYPDMPPGQKRHLMFSLQVDEQTIRRLNKHIEAYTALRAQGKLGSELVP